VLNHIVDILLVQLVRAWLTLGGGDGGASWLAALTDPIVGPALTATHASPDRDWTVTVRAHQIGISRTTLARRFANRVGDSPGAYLRSWRVDLAARRLRDTEDPVAVIARSVGCTSEYAFNRAFARDRGMPPGRYRHAARSWTPTLVEQPAT
jgi:transcriptional regulator GlxA family with amidase domain